MAPAHNFWLSKDLILWYTKYRLWVHQQNYESSTIWRSDKLLIILWEWNRSASTPTIHRKWRERIFWNRTMESKIKRIRRPLPILKQICTNLCQGPFITQLSTGARISLIIADNSSSANAWHQMRTQRKRRRTGQAQLIIIILIHGSRLSLLLLATSSSKPVYNRYHHIFSTDERNGFLDEAEFRGQQTPPHKYDPIKWVSDYFLLRFGCKLSL